MTSGYFAWNGMKYFKYFYYPSFVWYLCVWEILKLYPNDYVLQVQVSEFKFRSWISPITFRFISMNPNQLSSKFWTTVRRRTVILFSYFFLKDLTGIPRSKILRYCETYENLMSYILQFIFFDIWELVNSLKLTALVLCSFLRIFQ